MTLTREFALVWVGLMLAIMPAQAQQGNLPKPIQALPSYPPVVCVAPNWKTESCEERQERKYWALLIAEVIESLKILENSWVGTAMRYTEQKAWDGKWPVERETVVLFDEPGGISHAHIARFRQLERDGVNVEMRGVCDSACTFIMSYVPKTRICFDEDSKLRFHLARDLQTGQADLAFTQWMVSTYPKEIREWLIARGGVANMTFNFWTLPAEQLWEMGYRKCTPKPIVPMTILPPGAKPSKDILSYGGGRCRLPCNPDL
jgi:hypothetical protein